MLNEKSMIKAFKMKCEQAIEESSVAEYPSDVDSAYATYCEAEGMADLLQAGYEKPLMEANKECWQLLAETWGVWNKANSRICYDPVTGARKVGA